MTQALKSNHLLDEKRELLYQLLRRQMPLPLTGTQKEFIFMERFRGGQHYNTLAHAFNLEGPLNVTKFKEALSLVAKQHQILKTSFSNLEQSYNPSQELPFFFSKEVQPHIEQQTPFPEPNLWRCHLWETAPQVHTLLFQWHHLIMDHFSMGIFFKDLNEAYSCCLAGRSWKRKDHTQFADHALWEAQWLADHANPSLSFWQSKLQSLEKFKCHPGQSSHNSQNIGKFPFKIEASQLNAIERFASGEKTTPFTVLLHGFLVMLQQWTQKQSVTVGVPFHNRKAHEHKCLGPFANLLPITASFHSQSTHQSALSALKKELMHCYQHQAVPFSTMASFKKGERSGNNPFFEVMFVYADDGEPFSLENIKSSAIDLPECPLHVEIDLQLRKQGDCIEGVCVYDAQRFEAEEIVQRMNAYLSLLIQMIQSPQSRFFSKKVLDNPELTAFLAQLKEDPMVEDFYVHDHHPMSSQAVIYIVPKREDYQVPKSSFPLVPVSHLPLLPDGLLDVGCLEMLPILNDSLIWQCERQLSALPGVRKARAKIVPKSSVLERRHLYDLILNPNESEEKTILLPLPNSSKEPLAPDRLAYKNGGDLTIPDHAPKTLSGALKASVDAFPNKGLHYIRQDGSRDFQSYSALYDEARQLLSSLRDSGLNAKDRVILQIPNQRVHFTAFWACILGGITPVTIAIAPSYQKENGVLAKLFNTWQLLGKPVILTNDAIAKPLKNSPAHLDLSKASVISLDTLPQKSLLALPLEPLPEDLVFFQLTSGSTGIPKCIQETHQGIIAHIHGAIAFNGECSQEIDLNWLPLDHVVPTLTCHLKNVYLGREQIMVESSYILSEPTRWLDLIDEFRVTHSWSPNFGFKLVADAVAQSGNAWDLSCLRYLMNAGEQVTEPVVRSFLDLLAPFGVKPQMMQPAFGMAEVCTCMTYTNDFQWDTALHHIAKASLDGQLHRCEPNAPQSVSFIDLGPPVPGVEIRIANDQNETLKEGYIGRLQIRGKVVTPGYLHNDEANANAFVGDHWFDSGDLGFMCNGRLSLTGRKKEMINVRGANLYCHEVEAVVSQVDGIAPGFAAACAFADDQTGTESLSIFFVPKSQELGFQIAEVIATKVTASLGVAPAHVIPLVTVQFPRTTSGKIQRLQLRKNLEQGCYQQILKQQDLLKGNQRTLPDWFYQRYLQPKQSQVSSSSSQKILIFGDHTTQELRDQLQTHNHQIIWVSQGPSFSQKKANHFQISPKNPAHFHQLFDEISQTFSHLDAMVHLWCSGRQPLSFHDSGLIDIIGNLHHRDLGKHPLKLLFVSTSNAPQYALATGLFHGLQREMPNIKACYLSLASNNLDHITAELFQHKNETEVLYQQNQRLVPRLKKLFIDSPQLSRLNQGGYYVISGGLGALGHALAEYLLNRYQAKLLLLGRRPSTHPEVMSKLARLFKKGSVTYHALDICDLNALKEQCIDGSMIDGIFHLAATYDLEPIQKLTQLDADTKLKGTQNLASLITDQGFFVAFSSITSQFGSARLAAYGAGNSAQDAVCRQLREKGQAAYCINWSWWRARGMSADLNDGSFLEQRGLLGIDLNEGLQSLEVILSRKPDQYFIGLDGHRLEVRQSLSSATEHLQEIQAWYTVAPHSESVAPNTLLKDAFGISFEVLPQPVDFLPEERTTPSRNHNGSGSRLEQKLTTLVGELLGQSNPSPHDDFFKLGGHSLLALIFCERASKLVGRAIEPADLFDFPTMSGLANQLSKATEKTALPATLLRLNRQEGDHPFFLLPPAAGSPLSYRNLINHLTVPVYGFQCPGLLNDEAPAENVTALVRIFADDLMEAYPSGPCHLGGWSFGGILAFELARQLEARGREVKLLALFDTGVFTESARAAMNRPKEKLRLSFHFMRWASQIAFPKTYQQLREVSSWAGISLPSHWRNILQEKGLLSQSLRSTKIFLQNVKIGMAYAAGDFQGPVTLFRARESIPQKSEDPVVIGTQHFSKGPFQKVDLPGNHMTLMLDPQTVQNLATKLNQVFDEFKSNISFLPQNQNTNTSAPSRAHHQNLR